MMTMANKQDNRPGIVPYHTKLFYGAGMAGEGIKINAFNLFLLFYYQQVVGLDPLLCGIALFLALGFDAINDPMIGVISDRWRSRWGRRHPFMFLSIIPLAFSYFAVFSPPAAFSQWGQFFWLLTFTVLSRSAMTLFVIPHQSLVAELTTDYNERTSLQSSRVVFSWMFGLTNAYLGYTYFLKPIGDGSYDPTGFHHLALFGSITIVVALTISSIGTFGYTLRNHKSDNNVGSIDFAPFSIFKRMIADTKKAFASKSFRVLMASGLCFGIAFGLSENISSYMNLFYWGFKSHQLGPLMFVILAVAIISGFAARPISEKYGKRNVAVVCAFLGMIPIPFMVFLNTLGVLPPGGSTELLYCMGVACFIGYFGSITGVIMVGSMVADVTDEHQLRTGKRQEGLLYSAYALTTKIASGTGVLVTSIIVKLIDFPDKATSATIEPSVIQNLGIFSQISGVLFLFIAAYALSRYRLSRKLHLKILAELDTVKPEMETAKQL